MELTYLIENYSYLKFIVDVYEEYSKKHEISDDIMFRKIKSKYEEAKTFLSFIETAITMLPINKRSNYNNQYEVVYRKSYIEKMKIKAISDLLNTSIYSTVYYSETFNREHTKTVFDNTEIAYQTVLKAIGILRRYLKITYEEPSFFPIPVKFGYIDSEGEEQNAQLIYLEYWENQMMAKKIAQMLDAGYDARFAPSRFVVLEAKGMLNADTLRELYDYIPNTVQYIHVTPHAKKGADVMFYQPQDFGLTNNGVVL